MVSQLWMENTVFDLKLVESVDAKPRDMEDQLYIEKKSVYKWTYVV